MPKPPGKDDIPKPPGKGDIPKPNPITHEGNAFKPPGRKHERPVSPKNSGKKDKKPKTKKNKKEEKEEEDDDVNF